MMSDPLQKAFDATPEELGRAAVRAARVADDGPNYDADFFQELSDTISKWHPSQPERPHTKDRALFHKRVRNRSVINVELPDEIEVEGELDD